MMAVLKTDNDEGCFRSLERYEVLDTEVEEAF